MNKLDRFHCRMIRPSPHATALMRGSQVILFPWRTLIALSAYIFQNRISRILYRRAPIPVVEVGRLQVDPDPSRTRIDRPLSPRRANQRLNNRVRQGPTELSHLADLPARRRQQPNRQRLVPLGRQRSDIADDSCNGDFARVSRERYRVHAARANGQYARIESRP